MKRKLPYCSLIGLLLLLYPMYAWSQNSTVSWSSMNMGFAVPISPNTGVKSAVGQPVVGGAQEGNTLIESGFLADLFLRAPLLSINDEPVLPGMYSLSQNYPNPFNPITVIKYELPQKSHVSLIIYDILGREVVKLLDRDMEPGFHQVVWNGKTTNGKKIPSGVYIARMTSAKFTKTIKMVLLQ